MYWPSKFKQYDLDDEATYIYSMKKLKDFSNNNKIDLYVMVVPNKCSLYYTEMNPSLTVTNEPDVAKKLIKTIKNTTNIDIIYPYDSLKNNFDEDLLYYKADHHWTHKGSFIAYNLLLREIIKNYPNIKPTQENDYIITYNNYKEGDNSQYKLLKINNEKVFDTKYKMYSHKNSKTIKSKKVILTKNPNIVKFHYIYKNPGFRCVLFHYVYDLQVIRVRKVGN